MHSLRLTSGFVNRRKRCSPRQSRWTSLSRADTSKECIICFVIWLFYSFFNPPPRSGWGIIEMAFVCPSVNLSVRPSVSPSVTLSCPLHISWTLWKILLPLEGFSLNFGHMFALVRRCAKLVTQLCPHKVKVTVQGHRFEPWISCQLCISWTIWKIFIKLWSNVRSVSRCAEPMSTMPTQGQGHRSRSYVWALNFVSAPYLMYHWKDFL